MVSVKYNVGHNWETLHNAPDLPTAKQWALDHISYTGSNVIRVELRDDHDECLEVIFSRNWPIV